MNNFTAEQQAAIETLDCNLLVKAGAGAGKTRVLAERYIHILATEAAGPEGIVAITFTRKAAREMKERIRAKIQELLAAAAEPKEWRRWREVANHLDTVAISTIHSLCSRILREHPAEAGVDPEFGLMEDVTEQEMVDEVWQKTLEQAALTNAPWMNRLLAVYSPAQLRDEFRPLFDEVRSAGWMGPGLDEALWPMAERKDERPKQIMRLKQAYLEVFDLAAGAKKKTVAQERLLSLQGLWADIERTIDDAGENPAGLEELEAEFSNMRGGAELSDALQERKRAAEALRGAVLDQTALRLLPDQCEWFRQAGEEWARQKRTCRMLTYDDLEAETEKLLLTHPEICGRYQRRIRFLLVDECQDINERQRRIIYLLAGGEAERLRRATLFAVGDVKQSIYRFRGADTRVFDRVQADVLASGGRVIELLDNFRSRPQLVKAFNDFFGELMPAPVCEDETGGADTVEYRHLKEKQDGEGSARVDLWVLDAATATGDVREREAAMIARRIREMVESAEPAVKYRDIAVLLRAFTSVNVYEQAFAKAGIPYYVTGSRGFVDRQEIADVLGLLRFLDNVRNEAALFGVLRSPFFLLSDEGLLRLRRAAGEDGLWAGLAMAAETAGLSPADRATAEQARLLLEQWLARRGFLSPAQLIREAFAATGFDLLQLTQFMGTRRYANLQKLLDMADAFMAGESGGIADFLEYVALRAGAEGEAELDSEAGDTVRIMTIHKSKGLEFPTVIVPDLQRKFNSWSRLAVFVKGVGMGLKVPDRRGKLCESGRFRKIARVDNAQERAELKRVLYVAMTRAEQRIILSGVVKTAKTEKTLRNASGWLDWAKQLFGLKGSPRDWPANTCLGGTCLHVLLDDETAVDATTLAATQPQSGEGAAVLPLAAQQRISPISVRKSRPMILSPSYLTEFFDCPRRYYYAQLFRWPAPPDSGTPAMARPVAGTGGAGLAVSSQDLGTAFHRFMELLTTPQEWRVALAQALRETLSPELRETAAELMTDWASRYASSDLYAEILSIRADRREWPFHYRLLGPAGALPAVWLSGQADRVVFYPDGTLGVIDYKTDHVTAENMQQKTAHYRLQLAGYALAARAVFGLPVRDVRLYFVRTARTMPIDAGEEALARAERELQEIAGFIRSHSDEPDYVCRTSHCPVCPFQPVCVQD